MFGMTIANLFDKEGRRRDVVTDSYFLALFRIFHKGEVMRRQKERERSTDRKM